MTHHHHLDMQVEHRRQRIVLWIIILLAITFRFWHLDSLPVGIQTEEASIGNSAEQALASGALYVYDPVHEQLGLMPSLQAIVARFSEPSPLALRIIPAILGVLSVLGLYLLVRRLFNWQMASIAAGLMAVSFNHIAFSRSGDPAILALTITIWALYFLWHGLTTTHILSYVISGLLFALGLYSYGPAMIMPLISIPVLWAFWKAQEKDVAKGELQHAHQAFLRGLGALLVVTILIAAPLIIYFSVNPDFFFGPHSQSWFTQAEEPITTLLLGFGKAFEAIMYQGDTSWAYNLGTDPLLLWPLGIMFVVGLARSFWKIARAYGKHGHSSAPQTLVISWLIIAALPTIVTLGIPHSDSTILMLPAVLLLVAEGLWWLWESIIIHHGEDKEPEHWTEYHRQFSGRQQLAFVVIMVFLIAITFTEAARYFGTWANNPLAIQESGQRAIVIAKQIQEINRRTPVYVVYPDTVQGRDSIEPIMYLTATSTPEQQKNKRVTYIPEQQFKRTIIDKRGVVINP